MDATLQAGLHLGFYSIIGLITEIIGSSAVNMICLCRLPFSWATTRALLLFDLLQTTLSINTTFPITFHRLHYCESESEIIWPLHVGNFSIVDLMTRA